MSTSPPRDRPADPRGAGAQTGRRDDAVVPAGLVEALAGVGDLDAIQTALVEAACQVTGAACAAILRQDEDDRLRLDHDRDSGLPGLLVIGDVSARLWRVLLGQAALRWHDVADAPAPLAAHDGWGSGIVVRMPTRSGPPRLLAIASPMSLDDDVVRRVEALAAVAGPAVENVEMSRSAIRARALLERVTDLATRLTAASEPLGLLHALVTGLCSIDVVQGAAVWSLQAGEPPRLLVEAADRMDTEGLDDIALQRVLRILSPATEPAMTELLADAGPLADGRQLTLLPISLEPRRVLGLIHSRSLDPDERGVFSTLVGAIDPALRQAALAVERRSLVTSFGRVLRPHTEPDGIDVGVELHPNTGAAETFGGDFYDWFDATQDRVLLALGDVSGKGIPAAAASSMAVWSLRALGRQGTGPGLIAHLLDTAVAEELGDDRFVTLALLDVDTATWQLRLVLAGHPAPLLLGCEPPPEGLTADRPLGVLPEGPAFRTMELSLDPGQSLVLFTDGVADAVRPGEGRLGVERLEVLALEAAARGRAPAVDIAQRLWAEVLAWAGGPPDDDCAIMVLRRPTSG